MFPPPISDCVPNGHGMNESALTTALVALFPFILVGIGCGICLLLSAVGGSRKQKKVFPAQGQPLGRRFNMQGGKVGQVPYSGCLTISTSAEGLCLSVLLPFRFGHPPLFIPWDAIHNVKTHRFLWFETVVFDVGSPSVTLQLPKKIFEGHSIVG